MDLFDKKQARGKVQNQKTKKIWLNELSEDTLLNVAGGQTYHNDADKRANEDYLKGLSQETV